MERVKKFKNASFISVFKMLTAQFRMSPAKMRFAPFQLYVSSNIVASGAKANVPKPEPQTAIPVASDLFVSK